MNAVLRKTLADVSRRKLQTAIVGIVVFLSTLTGVLALTLLVETDAPFDPAFEQEQGAQLYVSFDSSRATEEQVRATGSMSVVSAANGPWRVMPASILFPGGRERVIPVAGRSQAGGPAARIAVEAGRWVEATGEVVLSRQLADETGLRVGDTMQAASDSPLPSLRVVGIGVALGNDAAAWGEPGQLPSNSSPNQPPAQYLMAYRLRHSATAGDIASAVDAITAAVPSEAVMDTSNYLAAKLDADRTTAVMIPFLLAFSPFALIPDLGQLPSNSSPNQPPAQYLMAYRLRHSATAGDIASAVDAITAAVPSEAVMDTSNYLAAKLDADRTTAVMIPFLLAFSAFALIASALIIANLVGGAVIAGIREIGIMKSVGFTPAQVVAVFAGQMLLPAAMGCVAGVPAGIALSQPFLDDTAHAFGLPRTFGVAPGPDTLGAGAILLVVALTSVLASLRAGRQRAAEAIAAGSAPASQGGSWQARVAAALPLPRAISLGVGESLVRPVRSLMTVLAIVIGVATVTFAFGLHTSLGLVASALLRDQQVQVHVYREAAGKNDASGMGDEDVTSLIARQPGTARFAAVGHASATVAGAGEAVPVFAYRGDSSWLGYLVIHGRWFNAPGEAVAPTALFTRLGKHVGDAVTADFYGTTVQLHLVGEIFDQQGDNILLRTGFDSVPVRVVAWDYEVQLRSGTDPVAYASTLEAAGPGVNARLNRENGIDTAFLLINSVLAGLALVLTLIAISGVFNTVVLNTRERARELAILKSVGMTPRQVITMVLASVAVLGVAGALAGIPTGITLHRNILTLMGQIATSTGIPDVLYQVFGAGLLAALAASG